MLTDQRHDNLPIAHPAYCYVAGRNGSERLPLESSIICLYVQRIAMNTTTALSCEHIQRAIQNFLFVSKRKGVLRWLRGVQDVGFKSQ